MSWEWVPDPPDAAAAYRYILGRAGLSPAPTSLSRIIAGRSTSAATERHGYRLSLMRRDRGSRLPGIGSLSLLCRGGRPVHRYAAGLKSRLPGGIGATRAGREPSPMPGNACGENRKEQACFRPLRMEWQIPYCKSRLEACPTGIASMLRLGSTLLLESA